MRRSLLKKRLRNLTILVGRYYLDRYGIRNSAKVIRALLGYASEGLNVDELSRSYLSITMANLVVNDLVHAVTASLNDYVRYREFHVTYDEEAWGPVDVARTISVYPSGLYASLTYLPTNRSPEYVLLREMTVRSLKLINKVRNNVVGIKPKLGEISDRFNEPMADELESRINALSDAIKRLRGLINKLPRPSVRYSGDELLSEVKKFLPYSPSWFIRAYDAYLLSRHLLKPILIAQRRLRISRRDLVLLGWRLYEIFVYTLLLSIFIENGYRIVNSKPRRIRLTKGTEEVLVLFNSALDNSIISDVNGDTGIAERIRGRLDAAVSSNERVIVVECKFSSNPTYITAGRFKAMAYMHEYNANLGIVAFPYLAVGVAYDEEEEATEGLWNMMVKSDGIARISLRNGEVLYMVRVDPAEKDEPGENWEISKLRLTKVLKHVLNLQ